ncbi:large ribosomal subunit protein eL29-like [Glossophaga mutica]
MCFSKNYNKKGLEKVRANNAKAMSTLLRLLALLWPKEVKPKIPRGSSPKLCQLDYMAAPSSGNVLMPTFRGPWALLAKVQGQAWTKPQAEAEAPASKGAQTSRKAPQKRLLSAGVRTKGPG